jgi:hypothetical protein
MFGKEVDNRGMAFMSSEHYMFKNEGGPTIEDRRVFIELRAMNYTQGKA